ncbi:hypothetical protein CPB86DRAFT_348631 [Serendipita vermifera]|nr:hypothetical protein CPB86DRAFT_348631 [Serendipita vermifera]
MQSTTSESNEEERINLLRRISTLESKGEDSLPTITSLRDFKSRYNALVEASIQRTHYPDLFQYLPTEIWMQILLEVIDDDCLNILPLLQVCQRWVSILVSEPRLWTSVYISQPLCMTVDIPIVSIVQERFLQRRIRHLKVKAVSGYFQTWEFSNQNAHIVQNLLKGLEPLPSLESLTIDIDTDTISKATLSIL